MIRIKKTLYALVLCFSILIPAFSEANIKCEDLVDPIALKKKSAFVLDLKRKYLAEFSDDILAGLENPAWRDFDWLEGKTGELSNSTDLKAQWEELHNMSLNMSFEKDLFAELNTLSQKVNPSNYGPTDYGLRKAFREKLSQLPYGLGDALVQGLMPLPLDYIKEWSKIEAEELIAQITEQIGKQYSTTGFNSKKEILEKFGKPDTISFIENAQYEIGMFRPVRGRFWIPKVGFQNQYVTKSSRGAYNPTNRERVEVSRLNLNLEDYLQKNIRLRPNYGLVLPNIKNIDANTKLHYGEDLYIFKKNRINKRTTWTLGDSLNDLVSIAFQKKKPG